MEYKGFVINVIENSLGQFHYSIEQDGSEVACSASSEIGTDGYGFSSEAKAIAAAKRKINEVRELV